MSRYDWREVSDCSVAIGVERASYADAGLLHDMSIDHGCAHVFVSKKVLNCADVIPVLEKVRGE